jgi:hypothetical protein
VWQSSGEKQVIGTCASAMALPSSSTTSLRLTSSPSTVIFLSAVMVSLSSDSRPTSLLSLSCTHNVPHQCLAQPHIHRAPPVAQPT